MFGLRLGKLGSVGRALAEWTPAQLWPLGAASPGLWIDPPYTASMYQDSAGTTAISAIGTVLDTSNPVGLALDRKGGATTPAGAGIHLSQATSAARPLASARVNLLTKTEDFADAVWGKNGAVSSSPSTLIESTSTNFHGVTQQIVNTLSVGASYKLSVTAKAFGRNYLMLYSNQGNIGRYFDVTPGTAGAVLGPYGAGAPGEISALGNDEFRCSIVVTTINTNVIGEAYISDTGSRASYTGDGTSGLHLSQADLRQTNSSALPYQRVNTASDYTATGFPTYLKFDGVDDALTSATFAAGTLTSSMDCLIAVRRDSAAATYLISDTVSRGFFEWESGDTNRPDVGAGMPTYYVDGVACTATRGALFTALAAGSWHILEARGLDLSTWTALGVSSFVSYLLNGGLGGIQLFASGQDANRDLARAQMAAYFGVTLP